MNNLASSYHAVGKLDDQAGADTDAYPGELAGLGLNLLEQEKWRDAEMALRACLTIR